MSVLEADGAALVKQRAHPGRPGHHLHPGRTAGLAQVRIGGIRPHAVAHIGVESAEALLTQAIDIVGPREARLLAGPHECLVERVQTILHANRHRSFSAPIRVGATLAPLEPLVIGQHSSVRPAARAFLHPALVVERIAAQKNGAVDRRRAAERLAARLVDAPVVEVRLSTRVEVPVETAVRRVVSPHRARHLDRPVTIGFAGLEQQHPVTGRGEAIGHDTAGRAGPHYHVVEPLAAHAG